MTTPRHLLVFRFSALGDVAMTIPVIRLLLQQYPELKVTFVSNSSFQPLFTGIDRLHFHPADLEKEHKGIAGLYRLYNQLKQQYDFDAIADLHQVLRTKALRTFFSFSSIPVMVIDKRRKEKKAFTRKNNKSFKPLPSAYELYAAVFARLGLPVQLKNDFIPLEIKVEENHFFRESKKQGFRLVGIAPFAKYDEKMYPAEKMKELIRELLQISDIKIFLFGGYGKEADVLTQWEKELPGVTSMAGKMKLEKELAYISLLDVMVSMDSANMHLASLFGVPVISVWGATHPFAGFYGWGQLPANAVQIDLFCRPCSVFGNKPCYRGSLECMHSILPSVIYKKIIKTLQL